METENDYKLAFLDTAVSREPDGRLTTSVYRKPTHTDQYYHPQSVKRVIVKCLYERAKRLVTKSSVICKEKKHLSSVLVSNGFPLSFLQKITKTRKPSSSGPRSSTSLLRVYPMQRPIRTTSPLPTATRHTRCFQVGDYIKITSSMTERRCRAD